jgi:zinc transporter
MLHSVDVDQPVPQDATLGVAWAYRFSPDGLATKLDSGDNLDINSPSEGFLWAHVHLADRLGQEWLLRQEAIPEAARRVLMGHAEHQQLAHDDRHVWGVVVDLVRELDRATDAVGHLRFVLGERFLVSSRRHPLQGVEAIRQEIESGTRFAASISLLETIVERIVDAISAIVETNVTKLDEIEDRVLDDQFRDEREKLGPIRRTAARMHRQLTGMRTIFDRVAAQPVSTISAEVRAAAGRLLQRIAALHEEVHSVQERARLLQEEISSKTSSETNRNLATLTAVTTLLLPPTLITGMFGMNVKGLLFGDTDNGYIYAMILCVASSALVYLLMRRIGLFR